jgi:hypothetical protein
MSGGEDWKARLSSLIRDADTVVFVLSPSSAQSDICAWEVAEAVRLGKRIIPVVSSPLGGVKSPRELADRDYTYFYPEPKSPGSGFGPGLLRLAAALNTDLDWLREHTRYLRLATEWEEVGKPPDRRLLSAADIALANEWATRRPAKAPELTALQCEFISASDAEDIRRQSVEAQRLREVAEAQAARSAALADREEAQKREAAAQKREAEEARRVVHRTRVGAAVALVLAVAAGWFALNSHWAEQAANLERDNARRAAEATQRQLDRANQAVAESINNDLGASHDSLEFFSPRQLRAVWKLAGAGEAIKRDFVSILAGSPDEMIRASPLLDRISRALGLLNSHLILEPVLKLISETTDPNKLQVLAVAIQPLPVEQTDSQASEALNLLLNRIGQTTNPEALSVLAYALEAMPVKMTELQASQTFAYVLGQALKTTGTDSAFSDLARANESVAAKLTETQASQALTVAIKQFGDMTDPNMYWGLHTAIDKLIAKLTEAEASQAFDAAIKQIGQTTHTEAALESVAAVSQDLAFYKLTGSQASQALDLVTKQIGRTIDSEALGKLASVRDVLKRQTLIATPDEATGSRDREPATTSFDQDKNSALISQIQASFPLKAKLAQAPTNQRLDLVIKLIGQTTDPNTLAVQAQALQALSAKLTEAQAGQVVGHVNEQIRQTTNPVALLALAQALQALPVKLTETQANQALEPMLELLRHTTYPEARRGLAQALQALAVKLNDAQAARASSIAASSLAWAATDEEAADWAGALVTLSRQTVDRDATLVNAIAYPSAAGRSATEVLLDAIRSAHPDTPAKQAGLNRALVWLAEKFPYVLRPPLCPPPLQQEPDLKCPLPSE